MIDFIALLIESYTRGNRRDPDCIVCNYSMAKMITLSIKYESQSSRYLPYTPCEYNEEETYIRILGLRFLPKDDMIPGAIIVCRMDEQNNYPKRPVMHVETSYFLETV